MGRRLGEPGDPLLVSVRSGAKFSMPGMMETVLNVGLNDQSRARAGRSRGRRRRRAVRLGLVPPPDPDVRQDGLRCTGGGVRGRAGRGQGGQGRATTISTSTPTTCAGVVDEFKEIFAQHTGRDFPQDPREQLDLAIRAVFDSWNAERAVLYRRQERIPADLGTAVNVVAMVFGNLGADSGTGVAFTRDPGSGAQGVYGDYLANAQGEDVVAGIRNTVPLDGVGATRPGQLRRADADHGHARRPLPRPVRHRVHHRARQAVDAADPGRQADRGGGVRHRHPAGRRGHDRSRRGAATGSPGRSWPS